MIKYLSLFSGIGAFEKALQRLEIPYELVGYCEIDKYASKAYSLLHSVPESMNFGDITQLDETQLPDDIDLITYGFPCQDISLAGQQKGLLNDDGTKTRSGLFFDALRIIEHTQPQIAIAENVKNLTSQKFSEQFDTVLSSLENVGYNNYWKVLNAKDYEVPQNRERVFIISIRKDIDTGVFEFPDPVPLKKCLKDLLEDSVEEKYYVDPERVKNLIPQLTEKQISNTVRGGDREPMILVRANTKKGYEVAELGDSINLEYPNSTTRRGRVGKQIAQTITTSPQQGGVVLKPTVKGVNDMVEPVNPMPDGTCRTIKNQYYKTSQANFERSTTFGATGVQDGLAIRKLTPKECFRLMGFDDSDVDLLMQNGISNTQLYKMAGNSIVVNVLEFIFCQIFDDSNKIWV